MQQNPQNKVKVFPIEAMRTFSILGVVLIHTTTKVLEYVHYDLYKYWPTLLLNQIVRFAVPLFFFISGFVLELNNGNNTVTYGSFIKKRFFKILFPYLLWSFVYYLLVYNHNSDNTIAMLLKGSASYQLYFIPSICIFYLLFPIIHRYSKYLLNIGTLTFLFFVQQNLMQQDYLVRQFTYPDPIRISLLGFFIFLFGAFCGKHYNRIKTFTGQIRFLLILILPYLGYLIYKEGFTRYYLTYDIKAFYSQWRVDILFYTVLVAFVSFSFFNRENRIIKKIADYSFFVFFVHVIVLEIFWKYIGRQSLQLFSEGNLFIILFDIIFFGVVAGISLILAYLSRRLKILPKITG